MNPATASRLQNLCSDHPEWNPWLSVVGLVLKEAADPRWESVVPGLSPRGEHAPRLAEAAIVLPIDFLKDWVNRLIRSAGASGTPEMGTLSAAEKSAVETVPLFRAALCQDTDKLQQIALDSGANPNAFHGVAELLPVPLLQACNRRLGPSDAARWLKGYCPLCGAWPALAEIRGIERARTCAARAAATSGKSTGCSVLSALWTITSNSYRWCRKTATRRARSKRAGAAAGI